MNRSLNRIILVSDSVIIMQIRQQDRTLEEALESNSQLQDRIDEMMLRMSNNMFEKSASLYTELEQHSTSQVSTIMTDTKDRELATQLGHKVRRLGKNIFL